MWEEYEIKKSAILSSCRKWRYSLSRIWDESKNTVLFIGLNPSTVDETKDDNTIRRCMRFSKDWGYGGMIMANLFAYRARFPVDMLKANDPIGPENDFYLNKLCSESNLIIAAWGGLKITKKRIRSISFPKNLYCLGVTKNGFPRHPLYMKADSQPILFKKIK
jgi:hypothetical protein